MIAIILSIGDELALGQTVDTNSAWMSQGLAAIGCDVVAHKTVADDRAAIARTIAEEAARCDLLLISGGLGPTEDDLTRDAIADVLNVPLEVHEESMRLLEGFFQRIGRPMPERNRVQAMLPRGSQVIPNPNGTAPGIRLEIRRGEGRGESGEGNALTPHASTLTPSSPLSPHASPLPPCQLFVMPGVPKEMKPMFTDYVLPWVRPRSGGAVILQTKLNTFGVGESLVGQQLGDLMKRGRNPSVGTTVSNGYVSVRINSRFGSLEEAQQQLNDTVAACRAALGEAVFGENDQSLVDDVAARLLAAKSTVATAESCTGGLLAKMLTDKAGSSDYFHQGWITYSNAAKSAQLGVKAETLQQHGAVSEATVIEMAEGARRISGSTYALIISGIAGPGGGTDDKPVGTVWAALATPAGTVTRRSVHTGDRENVRDRAAKTALSMLRYHLLGKPMP